ncbi:MAG: protelomerase family protein [Leptolyngbyaceae cyanobacterium]
MTAVLLSQSPDLARRDDIIQAFRQRIQGQRRTKLNLDERQTLALILRDRLIHLAAAGTDTPEAIQTLCQEEINLLAEGYPRNTLKSSYLPEYTRLLKDAIARGALPLTEQNSYQGNHEARRHYALDFLTYSLTAQHHRQSSTLKRENGTSPAEPPVSVELDRYLTACQALIASNEPAELIAGITATTGRAYAEVLAFSYFGTTEAGGFNRITLQEHPYLLRFAASGQEIPSDTDILAILPAVDILAALNKLRGQTAIAELEGKPFEAPETQVLITQIDHAVYVSFGKTDIVSTLPKTASLYPLRELYGTIAVHFFCPQSGEHQFLHRYLGHLVSEDEQVEDWTADRFSRYRLTRNQIPLTTRGVTLSSTGQLPMYPDAEPSTPRKELSADDEIAQELDALSLEELAGVTDDVESAGTSPTKAPDPQPNTAHSQPDQALIESLLGIVKQQSQTITILSETIAHLRADLATALQGQPTHPANHSTIQTLEQSLAAARAEQERLHALSENYRAKWRETSQRLTQIHTVASLPAPSDIQEGNPLLAATEPPPPPIIQSATQKQRGPGRPAADPQQSIVYRRAIRTWELTQHWNREHDYRPDTAIQLSKSLLTRSFGIHAKAIKQFWTDFATDIQAENQQLGLNDGDIHFNKGEKLERYVNHVKTILEKEGFYV